MHCTLLDPFSGMSCHYPCSLLAGLNTSGCWERMGLDQGWWVEDGDCDLARHACKEKRLDKIKNSPISGCFF